MLKLISVCVNSTRDKRSAIVILARSGTKYEARGKAIAALDKVDVLLVTRLDRLARSTRDLLNVLDAAAKAGAGVSVSG